MTLWGHDRPARTATTNGRLGAEKQTLTSGTPDDAWAPIPVVFHGLGQIQPFDSGREDDRYEV
jgi:hypothetical protein